MTSGKGNFLRLKGKRGGNVYFGDNGSTKIIVNGTVTLINQRTKEYDFLLVENMKHNLINVIQMCD